MQFNLLDIFIKIVEVKIQKNFMKSFNLLTTEIIIFDKAYNCN